MPPIAGCASAYARSAPLPHEPLKRSDLGLATVSWVVAAAVVVAAGASGCSSLAA